jgi:secreted PhoX family phosphatase
VRWGDPLAPGLPPFDPAHQSVADQERRFGYNCDFIAFLPLPKGSAASDRGLLCVNNEYPVPHLMFPGLSAKTFAQTISAEQVDIALAAIGHSIVEVRREAGTWRVVADSVHNRRITGTTPIRIAGPAAGHPMMRTADDPTGTRVLGTLNNCAGGQTPWGTVLSGEEGVRLAFGGDPGQAPDPALLRRYQLDGSDVQGRARHLPRFAVDKTPNEPNRFGWVVEIDPYDPDSTPVKRTALGRCAHEGAECVVNFDGRVVVYMGDDDHGEYIYRFVTAGRFDPSDPAGARDLLDAGELSVARFDADGTLAWLPLVHGQGPLVAANGFADQAEVLIKARLAADALGATRMDRPEDIEPNPVTGSVYAVLTKSARRTAEAVDAANPRAKNAWGHILELNPPGEGRGRDHAAPAFRWEVFLLAGNPADPAQGARLNPRTSADGWLTNPDNIAFDPEGRLWIATDGGDAFGLRDGVYATATVGPDRALTRLFFLCPEGAEATGPRFTPDGQSFFVSVQHPGQNSPSFAEPVTRWPDFEPGMPPRPSVVAISRDGPGPFGS